MPTVQANGIEINYEVQGEGEPMVLIPYLAADQACYAFQVADYAKHFTCFSVDLRGAGLCSKPEGVYTTELLADDVAAFMQAADYVDALAQFVRGRPMPPVDAFIRQSEAVLRHDATGILRSVQAPTLITYGRHDIVTSTRFAAPLTEGIANTELTVFEDCAHAAIYEDVEGFNQQTLAFLQRHSG